MPAGSVRALLAQAIDYAGLFPPASLLLEPALRNHASYVRDPDSWMLGAFILPIGQFDAAADRLSQFDREYPLRISALGPRSDNPDDFLASLGAAIEAIQSFRLKSRGVASIEQFEMPLPVHIDDETLRNMRLIIPSELSTFWEAPAGSAETIIRLVAANNDSSAGNNFGFKLRTGGVTAEAFPSSAGIATALVTAANHKVPIKFTAGLHHPVRLFHESVKTKMHGFLNVLGAGVLALEHGWTQQQTMEMLDDEDPASFCCTDEAFGWRDWRVATERIREHREIVRSFGSCSFDEPRADLRGLKLL